MDSFDQRIKEAFQDPTSKVIAIGLAVVVFIMLIWSIVSMIRRDMQTSDFIRREIGGILIRSKDITHGHYELTIKQHGTGEEFRYYLSVSKFFRENDIQVGDSIAKEANGHIIGFYKKDKGIFHKCCDLNY